MNLDPSRQMAPDLDIPGGSGGYYPSRSSSPEPEEDEELRRFKVGDRVRVNDSEEDVEEYLQDDNRVGIIVGTGFDESCYCWLCMDKPAIRDYVYDEREKPSIIPDGHAYCAMPGELELIESANSQKFSDVEEWRKNLKPGDKVRVVENLQKLEDAPEPFKAWKGQVVTIKGKVECTILAPKDKFKSVTYWLVEEDGGCGFWDSRWFELLDAGQSNKSREAEEKKKQPLDSRLKTLIQTALKLTQDIEKTFEKTEEYPIFGINLEKQEPVEKTRKPELNESLSSLGVVLYHLFTGQSEHNNHSYLLDGYSKPEDMPEGFWKVVNKLLKGEYKDLDEFKKDLKQTNKDSS